MHWVQPFLAVRTPWEEHAAGLPKPRERKGVLDGILIGVGIHNQRSRPSLELRIVVGDDPLFIWDRNPTLGQGGRNLRGLCSKALSFGHLRRGFLPHVGSRL